MNRSTLNFLSKLSVIILCILGLIELGLALWTVLDSRYRSLAYNLADVGYIDLWILRYISLCLFASSIITLVMCLILIWGLCSAHVFLFIASTMLVFILIGEFTISILTFTSRYEMRILLIEQLPKLVITYRQGTDERAKRALDILQSTFRCCGSDGRLSFQNNVPLSCNMYSIGCLTRTMFFLDSTMDALAYTLLFCSLIKLFIVLFFYSFLCLYRQYRQNRLKKKRHLTNDSSVWRHSSSFDSSSMDNLPKKLLISTNQDEHDNEYVGKRRVILNDYESSSSPNKQVYTTTIVSPSSLSNNELITYYEPHASRKLSSISEKTEKTETDDSEPDLSRLKFYKPKRKVIITNVHQKYHPPPLPIIKSRRKIIRDDDNDSGVEHSSSEKSFDDQKQHSNTSPALHTSRKSKQTNDKPSSALSFSKVFITSVSQNQITDNEAKKPLTTSLSDHLFSTDIITPKPILKKSHQQSSPSTRIPLNYYHQKNILPKPIPRSSLKQSNQDESLV